MDDPRGRLEQALVGLYTFQRELEVGACPQPEQDSRFRADVHRRLGELYEAKGAKRKAAEQYRRFVDLWAKADPLLQPKINEVRARVGRLRGELG
jgi:hypothetical protein